MRQIFTLAAFGVCLAFFSSHDIAAQEGEPRQLAPGVLTTIPVTREEDETFSGPRPLVEVVEGDQVRDWEPNYTPQSNTLEERSRNVVFRRTIEELEFSFKPLRMIEVEVPGPDGQPQTKLIWYMVYQLRNTGDHLRPAPGAFSADDQAVLVLDGEEGDFQFEPDAGSDRVFLQDTHGVERREKAIRVFPTFVLEVHDEGRTSFKSYLDRYVPAAMEAIAEREDPNIQFLNSIEISQRPIEVSTEEEDHSVWGIAMWEDIDPTADFLSIYVQGLSNAYQWEDPDGAWQDGDEPGEGRLFTYKTLQLNFWRPGDELLEHEAEIRYGLPVLADEKEIQRLLGMYGIEEPVDYLWIYR